VRSGPARPGAGGPVRDLEGATWKQLKPLWQALPAIARRLRSSPRLLLATDYDGTLVDIVPRPEHARLSTRTRRALRRLSRLTCARVAILSGRRLDDLKARLRCDGLWLAGTVGLETLDPHGHRHIHVQQRRGFPVELREKLAAWCARFEGAWIEDKSIAVALHFRQVPDGEQRRFVAGARARARPFADHVRLIEGRRCSKCCRPNVGQRQAVLSQWSVASELILFLGRRHSRRAGPSARADRGALPSPCGASVRTAEFLLESPEAVTWWLEWLATEWPKASGREFAGRRGVNAESRCKRIRADRGSLKPLTPKKKKRREKMLE
jgi:trehalose-phosphatase